MTLAREERTALVATLRAVGPDAPTLCAGWTTRDLVAHLVVREGRPDTGPGLLIPQFAAHTERVRTETAAEPWDRLLTTLAAGPPLYSPFRLVDRWANLAEMFVHHEDVLRGGAEPTATWMPRPLSGAMQAALLTPARSIGKLSLRNAPTRTTLRTPDGRAVLTVGRGEDVEVTGTPGELILFAFGRAPVDVRFEGPEDAVNALVSSKRGF